LNVAPPSSETPIPAALNITTLFGSFLSTAIKPPFDGTVNSLVIPFNAFVASFTALSYASTGSCILPSNNSVMFLIVVDSSDLCRLVMLLHQQPHHCSYE